MEHGNGSPMKRVPRHRARRGARGACWAAIAAAALAGCAASPAPRYYALTLPEGRAVTAVTTPATLAVGPVSVPDYVDRSSLLRRQGVAGLQPQSGHRWAEPLIDAVPRVLRQALAARVGAARVWPMPPPPGVAATHQLRVELQRLDADDEALVLQARWSLHGLPGDGAPRVGLADIRVALQAPGDAASVVAAHGQALDLLAAEVTAALGDAAR